MTTSSTTLAELQQRFTQDGYAVTLHPGTPESPRQRLVVRLDRDEQGRVLEAVVDVLAPTPEAEAEGSRDAEALHLVQIICVLPFAIDAGQVFQVMRLITLFNVHLEFPGFALDENNRLAFFRHVQPLAPERLDPSVVSTALLLMHFAVEVFGKAIDDLAHGRRTIEQIIRDGVGGT